MAGSSVSRAWRDVRRIHPVTLSATAERGLDEVDASGTIANGGKVEVEWIWRLAGPPGKHHAHRIGIDVRKCFVKPFRMSGWQSRAALRRRCEERMAGLVGLGRPVGMAHREEVWILLVPLERRRGAIHANGEAVFLADGYL